MTNYKRVLITGFSGFVGPHLLKEISTNQCRITVTYNRNKPSVTAPVSSHRLDITNKSQCRKFFKEHRFDEVYHLAGQSLTSVSWENPYETNQINAAGVHHCLEALNQYSPRARFLYISTCQVYGESFNLTKSITETTPALPVNPYAMSKYMGELICTNFGKKTDLKMIIARPFNHFGIGQRNELVFSNWCRQIVEMEQNKIWPVLKVGDISLRRNFLHVKDVVRAYRILMQRGVQGEIYDIAHTDVCSLKSYVDFLQKSTKVRFEVKVESNRLRRNDPKVITSKSKKMTALGWQPRYSAQKSLLELLDSFRHSSGN